MTIGITTLTVLALAIYRVCRLVVEDAVTEKLRNRIWARYSITSGIGYWITCYWCTSIWVASLFVGMYTMIPIPTLTVSYVLALSAVVGIVAARVD
jgi:hypothetical protein